MIKRLRRKFVLMVMAVVAIILLAIFVAILTTTQRNNERISVGMLQQSLTARPSPRGNIAPASDSIPFPVDFPNMRLPVLVIEVEESGAVLTIANQLHFIENADIEPIAGLVLAGERDTGIIRSYELRYLRRNTESGFRIALADISMEQEILKTQIANSLLIGVGAMLLFFFLSLFLARWAVRPVETAWERQKQFIANASHELKTPLTVILSNADMLRNENPFENEKNARRMEHIHAEAMRMKKLVEDMLTLAKSDSTEAPGTYSLVDFSYVAKSAILMYESIVFDEGKEFSCEMEAGISVMGDSQKLQQAIHILLDNALKYSPVRASIRVGLCKTEHKTLLLTVENEGTPIPAHELENIFLRFYRRDESRSEHGSFGLGLSIAQSIIIAHNGKIWADSDRVSLNRFYVSLPLAGD